MAYRQRRAPGVPPDERKWSPTPSSSPPRGWRRFRRRRAGRTTYYDADTPGLSVRVRRSGAAAYGVRYRIKGDTRGPQRLTLGTVGALPLAKARLLAEEAMLAAKRGRDPAAEIRAAGAALAAKPKATLSALIDDHERDQAAHGVVSAAARPRSRCGGSSRACWAATRTRSRAARSSASSTGYATASRAMPPRPGAGRDAAGANSWPSGVG